jgi:hypothetical protein
MVGTNEAQVFSDWNSSLLEALGKFMKDSPRGFESLGYGAIVQAANYRTADRAQAEEMVIDVFNPAAGTPSVATEIAAAEAEQRKAERHLPPEDKTPKNGLPAPDRSAPLPDTGPSALEQVRQHNDTYGEDERWRPVDPNAPVDDGSSVPLGPGQI